MIDPSQFGPWALVTGASSGIGREFALQIASSGIHVVLVARREALLCEVGEEISRTHGVQHRVVTADLSEPDFLGALDRATRDLDLGLIVSNAGTGNPGAFLEHDRESVLQLARLNALSHVEIAHHFGRRLVDRGRGGILLCGAMGAQVGIPYMASESGAKSYVQSFGEALHVELSPLGVNVTVLVIGPTQTAIIEKFGLDPATMPMKPMPAEQCAAEGLAALAKNRSAHLAGRSNRLLQVLIPKSLSRTLMGKMMKSALA